MKAVEYMTLDELLDSIYTILDYLQDKGFDLGKVNHKKILYECPKNVFHLLTETFAPYINCIASVVKIDDEVTGCYFREMREDFSFLFIIKDLLRNKSGVSVRLVRYDNMLIYVIGRIVQGEFVNINTWRMNI